VYVTWIPPIQPNGQIMHYNVSKHGLYLICNYSILTPFRRGGKVESAYL
jgi:hypothetical protein